VDLRNACSPVTQGIMRSAPLTDSSVCDHARCLVTEKQFTEDEAYLFTSIFADAEICQVVDPLKRARVAMDRELFESL
jgi:acetamidase/formamidase